MFLNFILFKIIFYIKAVIFWQEKDFFCGFGFFKMTLNFPIKSYLDLRPTRDKFKHRFIKRGLDNPNSSTGRVKTVLFYLHTTYYWFMTFTSMDMNENGKGLQYTIKVQISNEKLNFDNNTQFHNKFLKSHSVSF